NDGGSCQNWYSGRYALTYVLTSIVIEELDYCGSHQNNKAYLPPFFVIYDGRIRAVQPCLYPGIQIIMVHNEDRKDNPFFTALPYTDSPVHPRSSASSGVWIW